MRYADNMDELNTVWTALGLVVASGIVAILPLFTAQAHCEIPHHLIDRQEYFDSKCYGAQYLLPGEGERQIADDDVMKHQPHYQWAAVFLLCQALLFYLPVPAWSALQHLCGSSLSSLQETSRRCRAQTQDEAARRRHFRSLAHLIRAQNESCCKLFVCFVLYKFLPLANTVGQIVWMNKFLGSQYGVYGLEILISLTGGGGGEEKLTSIFPKVVLCDAALPEAVTCVLPANPFVERVYVCVWLWILYVATCNLASFSNVLVTMAVTSSQRQYVTSRLAAVGDYHSGVELSKDEYLIVRQVAAGDDLVGTEILLGLEEGQKMETMSRGHSGTLSSNKRLPSQQLYPHL